MKRRLLSVVLALVLLSTVAVPAMASNVDQLETYSESVYSFVAEAVALDVEHETSVLAGYNPEDIYLGEVLSTYSMVGTYLEVADVMYVPVFSQGSLVAFAFVTMNNGEIVGVELSSELVPELSIYSNNDICLIFGDASVYLFDDSNVTFLKSYEHLMQPNGQAVSKQVIFSNEIERIEQAIENTTLSTKTFSTQFSLNSFSEESKGEIASTAAVSSYPVSYNLNAYVVPQYNYGICWAAAVAGIGYELTGVLKTATQVATWLHGSNFDQGANIAEAVLVLDGIYNISGLDVYYAPDFSLIKSEIYNNGHPIYTRFWEGSATNDAHHAVFIDGYTDYASGSYIGCLFIGDSNHVSSVQRSYRTLYFAQDSVYPLTVGNATTYANAHILIY